MSVKTATLIRSYLQDRTIGKMGRFFTLEKPWLDNKPSQSCIPEGTYQVFRDKIGRFQYYRIENVQGRTHIEFHGGIYPSHTEGCVLIGTAHDKNYNLTGSKDALANMLDNFGEESFKLIIRQFNPHFDIW